MPIGIDFDRQFCRINEAPGHRVDGFEAATLTERLFNVLLVAALVPREVSVSEVHAICGGKKLKSTLTMLGRDFKGDSLLQVVRTRGNASSAHVRLNPNLVFEYETTALARDYVEDLFDRSSLLLPPIKQPVVVSSSVQDNDVSAALVSFGYALSPANVESICRAVALVSRRSVEPRHVLEIGIAAGASIPIIVTGEFRNEGIDLIALLRGQQASIYDGGSDGTAVVAALQLAQRPDADRALREFTNIVSKALRDTRPPQPATPLRSHMKLARSVAEAAQRQQRLAQTTLIQGRGICRAWQIISSYADREYKPHLDKLARRASGDSATEEDLLRAFCLARASPVRP